MKKFILILFIIPLFLLCSCEKKTEGTPPDKDKAGLLYKQGLEKIKEKDYQGAVDLFDQSLKENFKYALVYNKRGEVKAKELKQFKEALADFDKAIELSPKYAVAYNNRALCKMNLNDYEGAQNDFTESIKLNPENSKAYNNRGILKGMLGNYKDALDDFNSSINLNPNNSSTYINKVIVLTKMRDWENAKLTAEKAQTLLDKEKDAVDYNKLTELIAQMEKRVKKEPINIIDSKKPMKPVKK